MNKYLPLFYFCMLLGCEKNKPINKLHETLSSQSLVYATKFNIQEDHLSVMEPWPGSKSAIDYTFESIPQRVVVTSTTHLPYLELLGLEDKLVGFVGTNNIYSEKINGHLKSGKIVELGINGKINLELLLASQPDLVIAFDLGGESTTLDKIVEAGIPIVYNSDFLEETALGRAEWIKFFGYVFDKSKIADSIFSCMVERYQYLKSLTQNVTERPSVFSGVVYGDTWFLPGGKNWSAQFIKDAGGTYVWEDNLSSGWLELSFETVLDRAREARFWIGVASINTRTELMAQDARYELFEAYQEQRIYNYNKRIGNNGGFDFFESAYARPDLVLADLIRILHPELLPNHSTYYFQKIL
jgi:iron complex transport system substrate-binding protein